MFQFYANFEDNRIESDLPTNKIYEDLFENGISYLKVNIKELQDKLEQDINNLLQQPDWRPPPGQFDRAKQLLRNCNPYRNKQIDRGGLQRHMRTNQKYRQIKNNYR